jgi:predicted lipoprotein with Yx(FWY)xxD motif
MKRITIALAIASLTLGASVGVAVASGAHIAGAGAVVGTRSIPSLGTVLVGPNGHTLYLDSADPKNKATCTGGCATIWPPLKTSGAPSAKGGAKAADLGTISLGHGVKQVSYKGHALYYFASDTAAGQATGEGQNGFYVVSPSGSSIKKAANSSGSSSSGGGW